MLALRMYQIKFIADIKRKFLEGNRRVCGVMPCGAGKTLATADMTKRSAARGNRVVFMVHRRELIEQTSKTFDELSIEHGIIASGVEPNYELPVQIASVQTLIRRLDKVPPPNFLIVDECHHIEAATYKHIIERWNCFVLGLTATPVRMGGRTLHDSFDALVEGPNVRALIDQKFLADYEYLMSDRIDLNELKVRAGEYTDESMSRVMDRMEVIGDVVSSYIQNVGNRKAICYCVNIAHSKHVAQCFNENGIRAEHIDSETPKLERAKIIEQFRRGEITVLCNVELFGEGFDVPDMDCVLLARPTKSLTLYIQQAMRPLRFDPLNPNKKAIILDHGGNFDRFGELTKERLWSLAPNKAKIIEEAPLKLCPQCEELVALGAHECPYCSHEFEFNRLKLAKGEMIKVFDSTLKPVSIIKHFLKLAEKRNYKKGWAAFRALEYARSQKDCEEIARECGYKIGWGFHHWKEISRRQQRL